MPLYEYQCDACGRRFELIRKFSDPPLDKCPTCGGTVQKLVSSPAFQFKGTGFYITDYAKKDQAAASPSEQSQDAKSDAAASKEKDKGEKSPERSDKTDKTGKSDTAEKSTKSDKGTTTADSAPTPSSKDS